MSREKLQEGRDHLTVTGKFQSDKYPWCHAGFVPLKLTDPDARDLLAQYASRRGKIDPEFNCDLIEALYLTKPSGDRSERLEGMIDEDEHIEGMTAGDEHQQS